MSKAQFLAENMQPDEIYAGVILGKDGERDYHLILRPELPLAQLTFDDAIAWAASIQCSLPTLRETSLLFANCSEYFKKTWYWTCEQYDSNDDCAHVQTFEHGHQGITRKSADFVLTRAVRRVYLDAE